MYKDDIIYFELITWFYDGVPTHQPFESWANNDFASTFDNEDWVNKNKLCVIKTFIGESNTFCITATREWAEDSCPKLLLNFYRRFRRFPDENGIVKGAFGTKFLKYCDENIGLKYTRILVEENEK